MHTILELDHMTEDELKLGFARLGRLLKASLAVQGLSQRDLETISKQLYGYGVNKNTIGGLKKGTTLRPARPTLMRISPFCFRPLYFKVTDRDPVGIPVLSVSTAYHWVEKSAMKTASSVKQLPDLKNRITDVRELLSIVRGEVATKKTLVYAVA